MNITDHIEKNGLKRANICADAGISRSMLSQIEKGRRRIGVDRAVAFAAALRIPVHDVRPDLTEMFVGDAPTSQPAASAAPNSEPCHVSTPNEP